MKYALVSEVVPPSWSAQAVLIHRLLAGLDSRSFCLVTSDQGRYGGQYTAPLEVRCYRLPSAPAPNLSTSSRWLAGASAVTCAVAGIALRALHIGRVARRERCDGIIAFTGGFHDLPAAFIACRLLRLPLFVYMTDYYSHREPFDPARRRLSPYIERVVTTGAAHVVCGAEPLARALRSRYGIEPTVINFPAELSLYGEGGRPSGVSAMRELRIVYTGTVYHAQLDAVENLLAAIDLLDGRPAALHVYGGQSESELLKLGLRGSLVIHPHATAQAIAEVQQAADVLFLPLAFRSPYPEIVRTSAPMKFGEYLAAGGPILVHAPADSFMAEYCQRHDCAAVVGTPEPVRLAQALEELASDDSLRARLIRNARERAVDEFGVDVARAKFAQLLSLGSADVDGR